MRVIPRRRFLTNITCAAGGITAYSLGGLSGIAAWAVNSPAVETTCGKVRGFLNDGICSFRGVRYGASTEGKNLWKSARNCARKGT